MRLLLKVAERVLVRAWGFMPFGGPQRVYGVFDRAQDDHSHTLRSIQGLLVTNPKKRERVGAQTRGPYFGSMPCIPQSQKMRPKMDKMRLNEGHLGFIFVLGGGRMEGDSSGLYEYLACLAPDPWEDPKKQIHIEALGT